MIVELISLAFPATLIAAMLTDLHRFEIPNRFSIILVVTYPIAAVIAGQDAKVVLFHGGVAIVALLVGMALYFLRVFGGGDAKLIAAAALWTGPEKTIEFAMVTAIAGGVLALFLMVFWRLPLSTRLAAVPGVQRLHDARRQVPYAVAIGIGGLTVYRSLPLLAS